MGGAAVDLLIDDGRIVAIGAGPSTPPAGAPVEDGGGAIVLPGLVEAHTHLDKTLLGLGWHRNQAGPRLIDKIDNERALKKRARHRSRRASRRGRSCCRSRMGITHIRSHVDVDTEHRPVRASRA